MISNQDMETMMQDIREAKSLLEYFTTMNHALVVLSRRDFDQSIDWVQRYREAYQANKFYVKKESMFYRSSGW